MKLTFNSSCGKNQFQAQEAEFTILNGFRRRQILMNQEEVLNRLKQYKRQYAQKYGILQLGIFGSFARSQEQSTSDLDICIQTDTPNPFSIVRIKEDLENLFHLHVDIVRIRARMNSYLKERIDKEGIYV
ncbi:MAG TPA: nucleotidyltransferase domain-containing protein [Candidatus Kapabacteria bacterium]|nr:nucleotidyltransferase domain-containing protein [Candidatus Kapabacteria bacterium]